MNLLSMYTYIFLYYHHVVTYLLLSNTHLLPHGPHQHAVYRVDINIYYYYRQKWIYALDIVTFVMLFFGSILLKIV